jgi:hypothetical protein
MVGDAHYYYHHTILTHTRCHVCAMHHHLTCLMKRPTSPSPLLHEYVMKTAPTTWLHDRMSNRGLKPSSPGVQKSSLVAFQKPKITVVMAKDWDIRAEKLVLFGTFTVAFFLNNAYPAPVRDLDCVELWAGVGSIVRAAQDMGYRAAGFEIENNAAEDLLCKEGFELAARMLLRVRPGGVCHMGPVCSSFGGLCRSSTHRDKSNFQGNPECKAVEKGNMFAIEAMFFAQMAGLLGVHFAIENPASSMIWTTLPYPTN